MTDAFRHASLLSIAALNRLEAERILDRAQALWRDDFPRGEALRDRVVFNLFLEPSTRTRASFEMAAKRLGADVINVSDSGASTEKGESLIDTAATLDALRGDVIVLRSAAAGAAVAVDRAVRASVVNAGDGAHAHPTQALLDALTLLNRRGRVEGLRVAIIGDLAHSRVARSNVVLLHMLGAQVRVAAPPTLLPRDIESWGASVHADAAAAAADCDAVMTLRVQTERLSGPVFPSVREYAHFFQLTRAVMTRAKPGALVMHPGPMNRGVEIAPDLADDLEVSVISQQVSSGLAVRMAVLELVAEAAGGWDHPPARGSRARP